jgi:Pyridine nucleotide-disulphide oxidoreductase
VPRLFADLPNAQALRTLDDALRLRAALRTAGRLAIVGAGLVGQEVASMAVAQDIDVTLIDAATRPFDALVGPALGGWLADLHRAGGVRLRLGVRVTAAAAGGLRLSDGARVPCDHVLVGIGVRAGHRLGGPRRRPRARRPRRRRRGRGCALGGRRPPGRRSGPGDARPEAPGRAADRAVERSARGPRGAHRRSRRRRPRHARRRPRRALLHATYERAGRPLAAVLVDRPGALPALRRRLRAAAQPEEMAA